MAPPRTQKAPAWTADALAHQFARAIEPAQHSACRTTGQRRGAA